MLPAAVLPASAFSEKRPEFLAFPLGGIPRGELTEIAGPASSGRTALLYSLLAAACSGGEFCAVIDAEAAFDPARAEASGVRLGRTLWVRCGGNVEHALKSADLLAQGGGFGLVALDLADTPVRVARRIPLAAWFRLRQAVANTSTALVSITGQINAHSCSALKIELSRKAVQWRGNYPGKLLEGIEVPARRTWRHCSREEKLILWM